MLNLNDTILTWTYGDAATVTTDVRINVSSSEVTGKAAGEYSDTLTFTASVSTNTNSGILEGVAPDSDNYDFGE